MSSAAGEVNPAREKSSSSKLGSMLWDAASFSKVHFLEKRENVNAVSPPFQLY